MRIITKENDQAIRLEDITERHIVVGIVNKVPVILQEKGYGSGEYQFTILQDVLRMNAFVPSKNSSIKDTLESYMTGNSKFEVFNSFEEAMRWLYGI